jgi:hypothetical protein
MGRSFDLLEDKVSNVLSSAELNSNSARQLASRFDDLSSAIRLGHEPTAGRQIFFANVEDP